MIKNIILLAISLILASIFWLGVISIKQNISNINSDFNIKSFNIPEGLAIATELPMIKIKVDSPEDIFNKIDVNDFETYIDFSYASEGINVYPIEINNDSNVRVVSYEPKEIEIKLEQVQEKNLEVKLEIQGKLSEDFDIIKQSIDKTFVKIKSAEAILSKIKNIKGILILEWETTNIKRNVILKAFNDKNEEIKNVQIIPNTVVANISITQKSIIKTVGIKPNFKENLNQNIFIKSIKISPNFTEIRGKKQILESINFIQTEEIDLSILKVNTSKIIKLIPPLNTEITDAKQVKLEIEVDRIRN